MATRVMKASVSVVDGQVVLQPHLADGEVRGDAAVQVKPGQSWQGVPYDRLRALGSGQHDLGPLVAEFAS